ncbi:Disco-interacting protein 2 homolog C,Disco-interacting protein 2,Disco-interacting protein 2 homolog A,Disco-interacting protein 2 homolog B-A,Disco-interacting protein 2 homolog B [Lepeophtheirus salmonis]|uniref:Disco-interacting protein 2 homolog C,Disco-interacting protein 2,Disco-interacting protein 2 homolog A,Disco-interacting protein 2 homolog B-A,Disco-interacting protein 2 homolog B n=1 Tax=Lepeophtheirus salmonis TaxID=72036 RepID=A0A7R8CQK2_LEPSM|nr:Disco-interacting protein 2 homolog C,Disco-interacting protein 2,Disco-interacting protein 2 homolog A,Disco-interacting protein 2 homolog B-A,Disco-interacting protein 2 homolog B [Lepeophtheirus salmonis]CAF2893916.1 Disco-interacting protein 2 homolog C,Disco-interacting protein 2,Disco-interacting protein 2 homolog A,Disco-interacting protein 2 homolog B-A,Disco-interacting protein 2 homolog B [Lepeophtheirus salmonis]
MREETQLQQSSIDESSEAPSLTSTPSVTSCSGIATGTNTNNKARSRHRQKRYTHNEKRYHSEVRQEAVQQALAQMSQSWRKRREEEEEEDGEEEEEGSSTEEEEEVPEVPERTDMELPLETSNLACSSNRQITLGLSDTSSNSSMATPTPSTPPLLPRAPQTLAPNLPNSPSRKVSEAGFESLHQRSDPSLLEQELPPPPPLPPPQLNHGHEHMDSSRRSFQQRNRSSRHSRDPSREQKQQQQHSKESHHSRPLSSHEAQLPPNTGEVIENLEPYDVLFLNQTQQKSRMDKQKPSPDVTSSISTQSTSHHKTSRSYRSSQDSTSSRIHRNSSHLSSMRLSSMGSQSDQDSQMGTVSRWKVSAKIQQLLNTLKRPKRRELTEFYEDDDIELEMVANSKDPNAPSPEGSTMTPAVGAQLIIPTGLPRNIEAAIHRYGSATYKAPAATSISKIAYTLLNRIGFKPAEVSIKPGDRIALVYPNNDPLNFLCAFYGCIMAGTVPVPIEVPVSRRDAGSQQIGFLLGSCGVTLALTSDTCYKCLPKSSSGEVLTFKGWPKLNWFVTENLPKPPKDWQPPPRLTDDTPGYVEYVTQQDGSVMGVSVARTAMLAHARTLTTSCNYTEGEIMVCVLDFKREVGLWHSIITSVFNGMHVIFIPYSLMKVNPASWMQMVTKHRATIAICKSRDLHWGLLATKDHRELNLSSLRLIVVADGANPWSLSSCDQFLSVFSSLRPDALCPCAASAEALTVSIRRPGREGVNATGRGVLSMSGLSHSVVRVDQENSLTSLTLQDCGQVLPDATLVVLKIDGQPQVCKTDEVGEICMSSTSVATSYWGLPGLTNSTYRVRPENEDGSYCYGEAAFVRTGLLGFLGPGGLVFICGSRDGLMTVSGRKHNTDDIIATVLAVEPMKFIYRGRIAVFSIRVLRDERICVVAEQRPDCSEEESFQWMSRVLQAVDSIHQVGLYCLALVPHNHLPKTPLGGIHLSETKKRFIVGSLHPANVLMCPHTCVTNLPKPREVHSDVGPASVIVGNLVQGNRLAAAQGRDIGGLDEEGESAGKKYQFISEILRWRSQSTADHVLFTLLNSKGSPAQTLTCSQLHKKAERIACLLLEKGRLNTGDHVALIYPPGVDLICAFYGCLYVGVVPVTIRPPHPQNLQTTLPTVRMIVDVSKSAIVLSSQLVIKLLKSKEASNVVDIKSWPPTLDTDDIPKKKLPGVYRAPTAELLAYLDFSVSTTGMLAGIKMSHSSTTALCRAMKLQCELYPSRHVALCLDPYCGLGFALWVLSSVYSGHHTILIPPSEVESNPSVWLTAVSQYKVRDTFCSYGVMELCTKGLGGLYVYKVQALQILQQFYVDLRALRNDRVTLTERGAPHSLAVMESGKLLPGVNVIIANPESKGQCGDSHLGEIWVQCPHNASGYFTIYVTGTTGEVYARTGYLGFLRRTEAIGSDGDFHDAVFVVGALDETLILRGMRYHPIDIENSVMRAHKKIAESAVFTWTNLLVVVAELDGSESEALDLVPLITNTVLEEHHLIVGIVVIADPGTVPINSRGEKQRMHLRDGFLADQLDPIYVCI